MLMRGELMFMSFNYSWGAPSEGISLEMILLRHFPFHKEE